MFFPRFSFPVLVGTMGRWDDGDGDGDGDGNDNESVILKMTSRFFNLCKYRRLFTPSIKREIRHFRVVVVQWRKEM